TDWNPALESGNRWFDRLVDIAAARDRAVRMEKLNRFRDDLRTFQKEASGRDPASRLLHAGFNSASARGELMGYAAVSSQIHLVTKVLDAADRTQQTFDTVIVAYALAWYQRVNGQYPDSLAKLAPTYLTAVPGDVFSGRELIYRPSA